LDRALTTWEKRAFMAGMPPIGRAPVRPDDPTCNIEPDRAGLSRVLDDVTLSWADFPGNRQYISVGSVKHDARVALFLMGHARPARLKILGRARIHAGAVR
jgi:predicted pyridoxine 5'-phosphate oxidase superfamily flavin-nucleotide-binding protein